MSAKRIFMPLLCALVFTLSYSASQAQTKAQPLPPGVRVLFSPDDDIESLLIGLIQQANSQILFNQRSVTNPRILHAIVEAYSQRKVYVAGLLEQSPPIRNYTTPSYLVSNGIPVFFVPAPRGGENSIRYMVIDKQIVVTGSYEWTVTSQEKNNENLLVIAEPSIAHRHLIHFESALKSATPVSP